MINVAGYSWDPITDRMRIMTPKIFHGEKKKGRFTPETIFFKGEVTMENITKFYEGRSITHATILSKTMSLYDPLGFVAPLKVYGSYICRRALIESSGDPLKEIVGETRELFLQYTYQVQKMEEVTFARNKSMMKRSDSDVLVMCTDAGHSASMMIFYIGKESNEGLKLDFVFSIGNLNNENGVIPRNELDVIERGTRQAEKLLEWMTPRVNKKILITDAKVPLLWLRNKNLRTQPFVQTRVHAICKLFDPDEMFYIKSGDNPADIGTKFSKFQNTYKILGDESLFRQGPECLKKGIQEAVRCNELVPVNEISPSSKEKDLAALEVVKLHQLVITDQSEEKLYKPVEPEDALEEEDIDDAVACLITMNNDTIENESWLNRKRSGYRAQKATITVKE